MEREAVVVKTTGQALIDERLRAYMLSVYNYMICGLALTGVVAYVVATSPMALQVIFGTPLFWVVVLAPFGVLSCLGNTIETKRASTVQTVFWVFAGLMGLSLALIFLQYTGTSIARVFFITAGTFGAMSIYGYTTRKDLSDWGAFLFMGLIGIILASVVNIFFASSALYFAQSVGGVMVFVGLTVYDTQTIKARSLNSDSEERQNKQAIFGALELYLDFLNLFLQALQLLGEDD
jgi:hypothetical protein